MIVRHRFFGAVVLVVITLLLCRNISPQPEETTLIFSGGNSFRPGLFVHIDGKPDGYYYDLWELWSRKTGVIIDWRLTNWAGTIPDLLAGKADVVIGVSYSPERAKVLSFSRPYGYIRSFLYFNPSISGITSLADLTDFPIGILEGINLKHSLEAQYGTKLKLIGYEDYPRLIEAAISGKISVFIAEEDTVTYYLDKYQTPKQFRHLEEPLYTGDLRAAVRKGDEALVTLLNDGLASMDQAEKDAIFDKWYGSRIRFKIPWQGIIFGAIAALFIIGLLSLWNTLLHTRISKATKSLKQSEEKFRALIEQAPFSIQVHDLDGTMIMSNRAWSELWKIPDNKHAIGIYNVFQDKQMEKAGYIEDFKRALNGEIVDIPLSVYDPAESGQPGEKMYTHARLYPLKDGMGRVTNVVIMHEDLSEKMKMENERKELESRLTQSEKLEAIGRLAGGIAHDFNNMLAGIMGYADVLQLNLKDEKLKGIAEGIVRAAKRSSELTDQLLAFARKGRYRSVKLDIHKIIADVVSLLKHSIDKRIKILQNLHANPSFVLGDPTQLQNAILNLAINASDAMPGGGELVFTTETSTAENRRYKTLSKELKQGEYLLVSVTDTGQGIPLEIQERIFEPFFTTKSQGKGVGMGLAAVYGIVKSHEGAVSVQSEKGKGSTFTILLPLVKGDTVSGRVATTPNKAAAGMPSYNILVVDDEDIVSETLGLMLKKIGHKARIFNNGHSAVDFYKKNRQSFDLAILDIALPDMSGREIFYELRKINPLVTVILASGYSINGEIQKILKEGAKGFIQKPFSVKELEIKINDIMQESGHADDG